MDTAGQNIEPHSVWLCLQQDEESLLADVVAGAAKLTGTAAFQPHMTLLGDITACPAATLKRCREVFSGGSPFDVRVTEVASSSAYFMSLFLDLEVPDILRSKRARLANALGLEVGGTFRPHISLAYGMSAQQRAQIDVNALEAEFSGRHFSLSRLSVVSSAQSIPISDWRVIDDMKL